MSNTSEKPNFTTLLCTALQSYGLSPDFVSKFVDILKVPLKQQLVVSVALAQSLDPNAQDEGFKLLKSKIPELSDTPGSDKLPFNVLNDLILFFKSTEGINLKQKNNFVHGLCTIFPDSETCSVLRPLLLQTQENLLTSKGTDSQLISHYVFSCRPCDLMQDIGFYSCKSSFFLKQLLSRFSSLSEEHLSSILVMMSRTHTQTLPYDTHLANMLISSFNDTNTKNLDTIEQETTGWNIEVFVNTVNELLPSCNWVSVLQGLDNPELNIADQKSFTIFTSIWDLTSSEPFPMDFIFDDWINSVAQFVFLERSFNNLDFTNSPHTQKPIDGLYLGPRTTDMSKTTIGSIINPWLSLDLIEVLLNLAETDLYWKIRALFKIAIDNCPELLLCGLAQVEPKGNTLKNELVSMLMPIFLNTHPNSTVVIHRLWQLNPQLLVKSMVKLYIDDKTFLTRILDIAQDLKGALPVIIEEYPFSFAIDLATLASKREFLNIEKWLQRKITEHGSSFFIECMDYIKDNISNTSSNQTSTRITPTLSVETLSDFFKILLANKNIVSSEVATQLHCLYSMCIQSNLNLNPKLGMSSIEEVEEEANSYFQKLYTGSLSIDDVISMLKMFKISQKQRERDVFTCMIHNLFDEYRFFHKYPDKELKTTAILFGSLIQHHLISPKVTKLALRCILEAVRNTHDNKLTRFGLWGIEQFQNRLLEWPSICESLLQLPHFHSAFPNLVDFLELGLSQLSSKVKQSSGETSLDNGTTCNVISDSISSCESEKVEHQLIDTKKHTKHIDTDLSSDIENTQKHIRSQLIQKIEQQISQKDKSSFPNISTTSVKTSRLQSVQHNNTSTISKSTTTKDVSVSNSSDNEITFSTPELSQPQPVSLPLSQNMDQLHPSIFSLGSSVGLNTSSTQVINSTSRSTVSVPPVPATTLELGLDNVSSASPFGHILASTLQSSSMSPANLALKAAPIGSPNRMHNSTGLSNTVDHTGPKMTSAINLDTLLIADKDIPVIPPDDVQDKLHFLINNLTKNNIEKKTKEIVQLLTEDYFPFFAQYFVIKRIAVEPNFHPLYYQFVDSINISKLTKLILDVTYESVKVLLASHKLLSSTQDRSLLKNLGSWLGMMTIAKNKPLLARRIAIKELLLNAFEEGKLLAIIPFIKKILESCHKSKVFRPPNPWLMAILSLLKEIHDLPDLKLTIKFEIETTFGRLNMNQKDIQATEILVNHTVQHENDFRKQSSQSPKLTEQFAQTAPRQMRSGQVSSEGSSSFRHILGSHEIGQGLHVSMSSQETGPSASPPPGNDNGVSVSAGISSTIHSTPPTSATPAPLPISHSPTPLRISVPSISSSSSLTTTASSSSSSPSQSQTTESIQTSIPNLQNYVHINSNLLLFIKYPHLRRYVPLAIDRAVREIITPVVERSVTVAKITTRELILKDFAMEHDGTKMRKAAHQMVQSLTSSLALVTCIEPLRISITTHLRSLLQLHGAAGAGDQSLMEQVVQQFTSDNLELGCTIIEKAASERAIRGIDEVLSQSLQIRQKYRENGQKYYDHSILSNGSRFPQALPEIIRPKPGGLTHQQLKVYDDFTRIRQTGIHTPVLSNDEEQVKPSVSGSSTSTFSTLVDIPPSTLPHTGTDPLLVSGVSTDSSTSSTYLDTTAANSSGTGASNTHQPPLSSTVSHTSSSTITSVGTSGSPGDHTTEHGPVRLEDEDSEPPAYVRRHIAYIFDEWVSLSVQIHVTDKSYAQYLQLLQQRGVLKADENQRRFFLVVTELAIEGYTNEQQQTNSDGVYTLIDAVAKLVVFLVKYSEPASKVSLLINFLSVVARCILRDFENKKLNFNQRPYFRIFISLMQNISSDPSLDPISLQVLTAFCNVYHILQPLRVPGFAFAWIELISHRSFLPKVLFTRQPEQLLLFHRLLVDLFKFLETHLQSGELIDPIRLLYKSTLRVFLVLLHDFPDFLCEFHFSFCDVIPVNWIQMRNLILSAFPRNMRLPDPFTRNLKVDLLPEIRQPPRILSDTTSALTRSGLKVEVDQYLKTRGSGKFLEQVKEKLSLPPSDPSNSTPFNIPLISSLVMYLGCKGIAKMQNKGASMTHGSQMDIFQYLANNLDPERRYIFLNAIANQLRYPNSHTLHFSRILLYLFADTPNPFVQEQITRVLLERLIVHRPHPWGLLITFIELIKNPRYDFWNHSFTHCAPEIERLFESVARSCMALHSQSQGTNVSQSEETTT